MEHNERNASAQLYELEPDVAVDISEQAFEELRVSLGKVEAMKQTVANAIIKAKEKDLKDHVETFRALLRKLVVMENSLKDEQNKKETAKLAFELDQLEAECYGELAENEAEIEATEQESRHSLTSVRYRIAAKLIGFGGVFACLLGCIAYLIFAQIDAMEVSFNWLWVAVNAVGVVLFTAIGISLNKKSLYYADLAKTDADLIAAEEEKTARKLAAEFSNIAAAAYALELEAEKAAKGSEEEKPVEENSHAKLLSVKKGKNEKDDGVHVTVEGHPVVALAVVAAGIAAVTAMLLVGKRPKVGKKEKKADKKADQKANKKEAVMQGVCFLLNN